MMDRIQVIPVSCQQVSLFDATSKTCNTLTMNTSERLKLAREEAGYTQETLAARLGVKQQSVQQWESGKTRRPKCINELASLFGVSVDYILNGKEDISELVSPLAARCPLIDWEAAKEWPSNKESLKKQDKLGYPANRVVIKSNCYMLKMDDDAMYNKHTGEGLPKDKYVIVDPSKPVENKNYVVARVRDFPRLICRQFSHDGIHKRLMPMDIFTYKPIDLTPDIEICGVVIACLDLFEKDMV